MTGLPAPEVEAGSSFLRRPLVLRGSLVAFVGEGYTGEKAAQAAAGEGIHLEVINLPDVKKGFILLPSAPEWE